LNHITPHRSGRKLAEPISAAETTSISATKIDAVLAADIGSAMN